MPRTEKPGEGVDWSLATWDGSRREALRRWAKLPLERVIAALEEMRELSDMLAKSRAADEAASASAAESAVREPGGDYDAKTGTRPFPRGMPHRTAITNRGNRIKKAAMKDRKKPENFAGSEISRKPRRGEAQGSAEQNYLYGGQPAETESAARVNGTIIRTLDGTMMIRVSPERETEIE